MSRPGARSSGRSSCRSTRPAIQLISPVWVTPDEKSYVYTYQRVLADLYVVEGLEVTLAAGTKLGPYEILAPIGAGGMGEVYRAKDPRLGRDVAIKVLPAVVLAGRRPPEALRAGGAGGGRPESSEHHRGLRHRHGRRARRTS